MYFYSIVLGVFLISMYMLIPGLALSFALFPRRRDMDLLERIGVSLLLGITTMFIQYFADKNFIVPINQATTATVMLILTVGGLLVWQIRLRMPLSAKAAASEIETVES